jgi:hypothetical protein
VVLLLKLYYSSDKQHAFHGSHVARRNFQCDQQPPLQKLTNDINIHTPPPYIQRLAAENQCEVPHWCVLSIKLHECTRCNCGVLGLILLHPYPYTNSLLRGVTFQVLPLSSYALSPTMLPLLETFWNSCCGMAFSVIVTFLWLIQYPETLVPLRQTSFLETARSHSEPNQGNMVGVPPQ